MKDLISLDYQKNPILFFIWSWSYWVYQGLDGAGVVGEGAKKRRQTKQAKKST